MSLVVPGSRDCLCFLQHALQPDAKRIKITTAVRDQLKDFLWLAKDVASRPTHLSKIVQHLQHITEPWTLRNLISEVSGFHLEPCPTCAPATSPGPGPSAHPMASTVPTAHATQAGLLLVSPRIHHQQRPRASQHHCPQ